MDRFKGQGMLRDRIFPVGIRERCCPIVFHPRLSIQVQTCRDAMRFGFKREGVASTAHLGLWAAYDAQFNLDLGRVDDAFENAAHVGRVTAFLAVQVGLADDIERGRKVRAGARKRRPNRDPKHDPDVVLEAYQRLRPLCSTEAETYRRIKDEVHTSPSVRSIQLILKFAQLNR